MVKTMAGYGISPPNIARVLQGSVSESDLLASCADELETGAIEAAAKISETLYSQAINGNTAALLHWSKSQNGQNGGHPTLVNTTELRSWLGDISRETISDLDKRGIIKKETRGQWALKDTMRRAFIHLREVSAGRASSSPAHSKELDLVGQRTRLAKAMADAREMLNEQMRGETMTAGDVEAIVGAVVDGTRAKALALPTRSAPLLVGLNNMAEIRDILTGLVHDCLTELASAEIVTRVADRARSRAGRSIDIDAHPSKDGAPT